MKRQVYRSWGQITALAASWGLFLLVSLLSFGGADGTLAQRDHVGTVLYAVIVVGSLVALWRTFRLGVVVDEGGLRLRSLGRDEWIPWSSVVSISCENVDSRFGIPIYGPLIEVAPGPEDEPGNIPMSAMASYRRSTAQARTDALASRIAEADR
ncbi:PH domain-containing protein [Micromonospora sp. PLK6-60]|uniref:PH domain-containing protein n=1 Tax=Micromonospora sp. PLK6-60 TaxID=2873383 RepID=UPI001CA62CAC|nr:PH domain-containing protein [Micromonospora sp. PLK6-60]MBY8875875.1 PH domain-containing protein [Micromonospora sp. PLK6-60]